MRNTLLVAAALSLLLVACEFPKRPGAGEPPMPLNKFADPEVVRIHDLADRRLGDSLLPYLGDKRPAIRKEAAVAMGSVADTNAGPALQALLADPEPEIAQAAAWALGQIGDSSNAPALAAAIGKTSGMTQTVVGEALGKCGDLATVQVALDRYRELPSVNHNCLAQMLYRAGLRKVVPDGAEAFAFHCLAKDQSPEAVLYAAALLGRVNELGPLSDPDRVIAILKGHKPDDVKQHLVRSLRRCEAPKCTECLQGIIGDPRQGTATRVNAIRAAGKVHDISEAAAQEAVKLTDPQIAVTAAEWLRDFDTLGFTRLYDMTHQNIHWQVRPILYTAAMADAIARHDARDMSLIEASADSSNSSQGPYLHAAYMPLYALLPKRRDWLLEKALRLEPAASTAAVEALISQQNGPVMADSLHWGETLAKLIATGDIGIVALCAEHIAADGKAAALARTQVRATFLDSALRKLALPQDIETYNALEKAIAKIDGVEPKLTKLNTARRIDWELVKRIPTGQTAVVTTTKGQFTWRFDVEAAPGTVAGIVTLIRQGFYKDKFFHRVVPAFVAQGGCPRGDGWGGTPETLRSEWPMAHYAAGTVGMASAGKDTESCQWFITHCSVPHLDGRYTIFAVVTEGMGVVQQLEIGDKILSIDLPGLDLGDGGQE